MATNTPTNSTASLIGSVTGSLHGAARPGAGRYAARLLAGVTFGALPLFAVACGSDDAAGADASTLTVEEFRTQGNELCTATNEKIFGIVGQTFGGGGSEPTPAQLQTALDGILTESRSLIDGLDALAAPPDLAPQVDELLGDLRAVADEAEAQGGPAYFATDDDPWAPAGVKAAALGLTACASGSE